MMTKPTFGEYLMSRSVPGDIIPSRNPPRLPIMQPYVDPTISGPLIQPLKKMKIQLIKISIKILTLLSRVRL
ncbi:MAG TPA: hypothetical protein VGW78_06560 [Candidatus Babeliales bacterium]|jgi:hypothetical protein|nr:hypothetical protein [Candidatus Babeliales bacterium]